MINSPVERTQSRTHGDGSEMVQWPCKGGKATGTTVAVKENTIGATKNPVLPWFGGPAKTGTSETGGGRSEYNPKNTTQNRTQKTTQ